MKVYTVLDLGMGAVSAYTLASISLKRLFATIAPLKYKFESWTYTYTLLSITWVIGIVISASRFFISHERDHNIHPIMRFVFIANSRRNI